MKEAKRIKILIVDDSLFFRGVLTREIGRDKTFEIIGYAKDVKAAKAILEKKKPDVITLDVEMPGVSGIEFLKELMQNSPMPVVVISSVGESVFEALNWGAVDFITKPQPGRPETTTNFKTELPAKLKIAAIAKVGIKREVVYPRNYTKSTDTTNPKYDFVVIGSSTGGTEAIYNIVKDLPSNFPGIVIVQHMPPVFTKMYSERLNGKCIMGVKEAQDNDRIIPGRIIIGAGNHHIRVKKKGKNFFVESRIGEKVNGHCPSVDVLFESVAKIDSAGAIGIILTGMGTDGANGMLEMKEKGSLTIGQSERSCVVYGMPKKAYEIGAVMHQMDLDKISGFLLKTMNMSSKRKG